MAELPFMSIPTDSFTADTRHMSAAEFGAYVRIICALWRSGGELPHIDEQLARIAGVTEGRWKKIGPVVTGSMKCRDGKIYDPALLERLAEARARSKKNREIAHSRWANERSKRLNSQASATANALRSDMQSDSNHNQNHIEKQNENHHHEHDSSRATGPATEPNAQGSANISPALKSMPSAFVAKNDGKHALRCEADLAARKVRNEINGTRSGKAR